MQSSRGRKVRDAQSERVGLYSAYGLDNRFDSILFCALCTLA